MHDPDPFDLRRFIEAQEPVIATVRLELEAGKKRTHWMWFVFPQVRGLGASAMAQRFALASKPEAAAYLAHSVLGPRLIDCTRLAIASGAASANDLFGSPDDLKFRSSMTLFAAFTEAPAIFSEALARFYDGVPDHRTLELLHD